MNQDQYIADLERRIKKLEGNDAFRDSETRAIRKLAESAERQVAYMLEPYHALQSHLDRFHSKKEKNKRLLESEAVKNFCKSEGLLVVKGIFAVLIVVAVITFAAMQGVI